MNRGWRFCRFREVLYLVDSSCSLVSGTPRFSMVFGRYWPEVWPEVFRVTALSFRAIGHLATVYGLADVAPAAMTSSQPVQRRSAHVKKFNRPLYQARSLRGRFKLVDAAVGHQRQKEMAVPVNVRSNIGPLLHDLIVQRAGSRREQSANSIVYFARSSESAWCHHCLET